MPPEPTRDGYTFDGWCFQYGDVRYNFDAQVKKNFYLNAKWRENPPVEHAVTFDSDGGSTVEVQTVKHGEKAKRPVDPTREFCVLTGWTLPDGSSYNFDSPVTDDVTLKAQWTTTKKRLVHFDSHGGSNVGSQYILHGQKVARPDDPTREGYTFDGWYKTSWFGDGTEYNFNKAVKSTFLLYAKWTPVSHTVSFDSDGGSAVESKSIVHGAQVKRPSDPSREHYTFGGWFATPDFEGDAFQFDTPIADDLVLFAKWNPEELTVTFDSNGGSEVAEQPVTYGSLASKPEAPTKAHCDFAGWYEEDADDSAEPYGFDTPVTGDMKLVAHWEINTRIVAFDSDGGTEVDEQPVPYGGYASLPDAEPTKGGFVFDGWYIDFVPEEEFPEELIDSMRNDPELSSWVWVVDKEDDSYTLREKYDPDLDQILENTTLHAR